MGNSTVDFANHPCSSDGDGDFAESVTLLDVANGGCGLREPKAAIEDRDDLAGGGKLAERVNVFGVHLREHACEFLGHERRYKRAAQHHTQQTGRASVWPSTSATDIDAPGVQRTADGGESTVADKVEHDVENPSGLSEVFVRVIDEVICPDGTNQFEIARAADAGDLRTEILCDLDSESTDSAGRAIDENTLLRFELTGIAQALQRGDAGDWHRSAEAIE